MKPDVKSNRRIAKNYLEKVALAKKFHKIYEVLAPDFGYKTREDTRDFDEEYPNGRLMIAVCKQLFDIRAREEHKNRHDWTHNGDQGASYRTGWGSSFEACVDRLLKGWNDE